MGIPHLITHLRPFATSEDLSGQSVVIDGPGLAYHIYYLSLGSQPRVRNPFDATPSPAVLGDTVLRWLDELQSNGVVLKKIYFDGFLPSSKRAIRFSRLVNYTKQLSTYYQAWPQIIPSSDPANINSHNVAVKLFSSESSPSNFTKIPATALLVPTILEALLESKTYHDMTVVVPGEADPYCAQYVRIHGGTVLTGDSDLLVHDLGKGSVTFLKDIELVETVKGKSLNCIQYNVATIAEKLGLPSSYGIQSLAFEMVMDNHGSFRQLLRQATQSKAISIYGKIFEDFSKEYTPLPEDVVAYESFLGEHEAHPSSLSQLLKMLDPRISEYVLQFPIFAQAAGLSQTSLSGHAQEIDMFLPFLLDCPIRTSAWEMSTSVRQLAYSLVNWVLPEEQRVTTAIEHRRQQSGVKGREWQLPSNSELIEACIGITDLIVQIRKLMLGARESSIWRAIAFYQHVMLESRSENASGASISMARFTSSSMSLPFRYTWDSIHFFAQLEGSYYSFRMLKQILDLVLSCNVEGLPAILSGLQKELQTLPPLNIMPSPADSIHQISSSEDKATWTVVRKFLDLEEEQQAPIALSSKKKNKKRKLKSSSDKSSPQRKITNLFEHLASE